jgi:hypothetical protein
MVQRRPPLPRLALEPDVRLVRWGWIGWGALTVFLGVLWMVFGGGTAAHRLTFAPAAALWLFWPLYRGGGALWRWMKAAPHAPWNGAYYEFDGRQMRLLFDDDDIYVVADDVFAALDLHGHATEAARVRVVAGKDGLRQLPDHSEFVFTERGLNAWLERRTGANAVRLRRWFEREVLAPHRNRRARQTGASGSLR